MKELSRLNNSSRTEMRSYADREQERLYYSPDEDRYGRNLRKEEERKKRDRVPYSERRMDGEPLDAVCSYKDTNWQKQNKRLESENARFDERVMNGASPRTFQSLDQSDRDGLASTIPRSHNESAFRVPPSSKRNNSRDWRDDDRAYEGRLNNGPSSRSSHSSEDHHSPRWRHEDLEYRERYEDDERRDAQPDYSKINGSRIEEGNRKRQTYTKFVSMVPTWNKFERERNLPDRIELRMCGIPPKDSMQRSLSIPDLCRVKMRPVPDFDRRDNDLDGYRSAPEFDTEYDYEYDHDHQHLHYHSPRHAHLKEMYVSQYTHYFDSEPGTPTSHIAGWKVDIEPQGIPHRKSRMCVLRNPLITGRKERPARPKSAPPDFFNRFRNIDPDDEDVFIAEHVTMDESYIDCSGAQPSTWPGRRSSTDSISDRFRDSEPLDYPDEGSSFGYAPSDDTSDTSSGAFGPNGRPSRRQHLSMSRPKLLPLSPEYPGIRNLQKMRKKRQSMGSTTSTGSLSAGSPSPTTGNPAEYGFCIALTSQNQKKPERRPRDRKENTQKRPTQFYTLA